MVQAIVQERFSNPFWFLTEHFSGARKILNDNLAVIDSFAYKMISDRRAKGVNARNSSSDLLDLFMDTRNDDGSELSDKQLRDVVLNMIIAGRDTTAQALTWSMLLLSTHPEVEEKIRAEALSILGKDDLPTHETLKKMTYSHAVFYEVLRLHPSVPVNMKCCNKTVTLPDGTLCPRGTLVGYSPYSMGRSTAIWGPDAREFKPERWIDASGNLQKASSSKWPAFHAGPRVCLGQNLATHEAITVLSLLVRNFQFEVLPQEFTYGISLTLPMKDGLHVHVISK